MYLIITVAIGIIGGLLFQKLKFPAGAMVGAMVFTAIFNVATNVAYLPLETKVFTQMIAGAYIGHTITKKDVIALKNIIKPAFIMMLSMIILDMGMGFIMYKMSGVDIATALMSSAPGGMMDIALLSQDVGADSSKVALLQLIRLMTVMTCFPLLIKGISKRVENRKSIDENKKTESIEVVRDNKKIVVKALKVEDSLVNARELDEVNVENLEIKSIWYKDKIKLKNLALTFTVAIVMGLIGYFLKVPAGAMTFSMFSVAFFNIVTDKGFMPLPIRRFTQMLAGILIGCKMTYNEIISLRLVLFPALILITGVILINMIIGFILNKVTKIDIVTSLIATTPGGVSDMALIAKDLGAEQNTVAVLQLFRYVFVIAIFPLVVRYMLQLVR